jgi:hypothetical protein
MNIIDENECDICFTISELMKICENNHKCCLNCYSKINKCHMCRNILLFIDLNELVYTDLYNVSDLNNTILNFIKKWKNKTFFLHNKILTYFNQTDLGILTSQKKNQIYTLYKGFKNEINDGVFFSNLPSNWTTNINIAKNMGKYIYKINVDCKYVLIDLNLIDDINEVILFGNNKYDIINTELNNISIDNIKYFTEENRETIYKTKKSKIYNNLCWTIDELKELCDLLNINYINNNKKMYYINLLIDYNNLTF